jgi:hypothetical protein
MRFFHLSLADMKELRKPSQVNFCWLLRQAMRAIQARERIWFIQNINAAMHPAGSQEFRLALADIAWDAEDPEYAAVVSAIAGENHITSE